MITDIDTRIERQAIEAGKEVISLRRWNQLSTEQRRQLVAIINSGADDVTTYKAYRQIARNEYEQPQAA